MLVLFVLQSFNVWSIKIAPAPSKAWSKTSQSISLFSGSTSTAPKTTFNEFSSVAVVPVSLVSNFNLILPEKKVSVCISSDIPWSSKGNTAVNLREDVSDGLLIVIFEASRLSCVPRLASP